MFGNWHFGVPSYAVSLATNGTLLSEGGLPARLHRCKVDGSALCAVKIRVHMGTATHLPRFLSRNTFLSFSVIKG